MPVPPTPHPSGARPPAILAKLRPRHVAIVMDGNGRWAKERGLPRTDGHARGEAALLDVIHGAVEAGVGYLSAYAFSTENWKRSPDEVRWLMGFNRDVIHRRRDELNDLGVRIVAVDDETQAQAGDVVLVEGEAGRIRPAMLAAVEHVDQRLAQDLIGALRLEEDPGDAAHRARLPCPR